MNLTHPVSFGNFFFVTIWLQDALPASFGQKLGLQFYALKRKWGPYPGSLERLKQVRKKLFVRFDEALDSQMYHPGYIQSAPQAEAITQEILSRQGADYHLHACRILPNHLHLLLEIKGPATENPVLDEFDMLLYPPLRNIIQNIQNATAATLSKVRQQLDDYCTQHTFQKRTSQDGAPQEVPSWSTRSFDFQIQDAIELKKVASYILQNGKNAAPGLSQDNWPFVFLSKA